jgi:ubiquinone/menaquinone biosynthesis C-methylase UbiE
MPRTAHKAYKGLPLEGLAATWYARMTGKDLASFCQTAQDIAGRIKPGHHVLEVAPGPGYLAIELAKLGNFQITGLDISKSFVKMAAKNAQRAGVHVQFHHGNAAAMPFASCVFDFVVCRAAFKNFSEPVNALDEMYRVLKPSGTAVIFDLRADASHSDITSYVHGMRLGPLNSLLTRLIFKHMLLKRAYSTAQFETMATTSRFGRCMINADAIGLEVSLHK